MPADIKKLIESEAQKQIDALTGMETSLNKDAIELQKQLYRVLVDRFTDSLQTDEAGNLLFNAKNIARINDLNTSWEYFQEKYYRPSLTDFANDLMSIVPLEAEYFNKIGEAFDIAFKFDKTAELISKQIGIDLATEEFIKDSYLDRLLQGSEIRNKVADYVLNNVSAKASFKEMKSGLEELVVGSEEVDGAMQKYLRTYAYDTFSNIQASVDLNIADTYGFNTFVYMGDVVKSTRDFCKERVMQVFTRDDIEEWRTLDWQGKNWDVPFEISRGGYNCRHWLRWIPDEAKEYFE